MTARRAPSPRLTAPLGFAGVILLVAAFLACVATLPWTLTAAPGAQGIPRYDAGDTRAARLPPSWWPPDDEQRLRLNRLVPPERAAPVAQAHGLTIEALLDTNQGPAAGDLARLHPRWLLGTDRLGRSVLLRAMAGGGISLTIGIAAAAVSLSIGTLYGAIAGYAGGRIDGLMMRVVDVLYGLPYVLLVVLLAVASDALVDEYVTRARERAAWVRRTVAAEVVFAPAQDITDELADRALIAVPPRRLSPASRTALDVTTLLIAIGGISWLTVARVVRGEVLSLKSRPFVEAARAAGAGPAWVFRHHLLPNLTGPILVYGTLTVPQAILQESFLSFLGIGVKPPLPSWGTLAADGLDELNPYRSHWWLLLTPSLLLAATLLALNFAGEAWREAIDPKRASR